MTVAADSTPWIYVARLGDLGLLEQLFGRVILPEAVWWELAVEGAGLPGSGDLEEARDCRVTVWATRESNLDGNMQAEKPERGEVEAIQLARELKAEALLLDEQRAVEYARSLGLAVIRTPSIYVTARKDGCV